MRPVSAKQKSKMSKFCFICKQTATEAHHPLIFAQKQIDTITIPLCSHCHRGNNGTIRQDIRDRCELEAIKANLEFLIKNYAKTNWWQRAKWLSQKIKISQVSEM